MAMAMTGAFLHLAARAQPIGAQAIVGAAALSQQGNKLVVTTQNGAGGFSAINWQSFSVPGGTTTYFAQPGVSSTSINRVVGPDPSAIFGTLGSNGRLVLVNPAGITVGAGAVVDTAGFTASTLRMSDADALSGRLRFDGSAGGVLQVDGQVLARSGDVVLIGSKVQTGANAVIQSPQGATVLAAGQSVEVTGRGLEGIVFHVQAPADQAVNLGTLQGDAVGIFAGTLKHSGLIQAQTVTVDGGHVVLKAAGQALVFGTVQAQGPAGAGGSVDVLGSQVGVLAGASIDTSNTNGGGQIRVGGDYQGHNASLPNSQATLIESGATLKADATVAGDGGRVIVWSDKGTRFAGAISARGGSGAGNGGFSEVSGKQVLDFAGGVDLSSAQGRKGHLLLDPDSITVGTTANLDGLGLGLDISTTTAPLVSSVTGLLGVSSQITANALTGLLNNTDVTLAASNTIAVNSPVLVSSAGRTLTLDAPTLSINSTVGSSLGSAAGALTLRTPQGLADGSGTLRNVSLATDLSLAPGSTLKINSGMTLGNGVTLNVGSSALYADGSQTLGSAGASLVRVGGGTLYGDLGTSNATFTLGSGVSLSGFGTLATTNTSSTVINNGSIIADGSGPVLTLSPSTLTNAGTLVATGATLSIQSRTFNNNGNIALSAKGILSYPGNVTVRSGQSLVGDGTVDLAGGLLKVQGKLAPGASDTAASLMVNGALDVSQATVVVRLASATSYDQIIATGNVALAPGMTLVTSDLPGANYAASDVFSVIQSTGSISGGVPAVTGFTASLTGGAAPVSLQLAAQAPATTVAPIATPVSTPVTRPGPSGAPTLVTAPAAPGVSSGSSDLVAPVVGGNRALASEITTQLDSAPLVVFSGTLQRTSDDREQERRLGRPDIVALEQCGR